MYDSTTVLQILERPFALEARLKKKKTMGAAAANTAKLSTLNSQVSTGIPISTTFSVHHYSNGQSINKSIYP